MSNSYTLSQHLVTRSSNGTRGGGASSSFGSFGSTSGNEQAPLAWHKHSNLTLLERFSADNDGYLYLLTTPATAEEGEGEGQVLTPQPTKIKAAWADEAGMAKDVAKTSSIWQKFADYLSKTTDDTAQGHITFNNGLTTKGQAHLQEGAVFGALPTYYVDKEGRAHLRHLAIDETLEVPELRYNRTTVHIGYDLQSPAAGIIERVERLTDEVGKVYLKLQEGEFATVEVGDLLTGIFHATKVQGGATKDTDDGRLNLTFAGFATAYFKVETVDSARKWFTYSLRPNTTFHPQPHMTFASRGSVSRPERQHFAIHTRTYTRYLRGVNQWDILARHVAMQQGELDNLHELGFSNEITGVGLFTDNAYFVGKVIIDGKLREIPEIVGELEGKIQDNLVSPRPNELPFTTWAQPSINAVEHQMRAGADKLTTTVRITVTKGTRISTYINAGDQFVGKPYVLSFYIRNTTTHDIHLGDYFNRKREDGKPLTTPIKPNEVVRVYYIYKSGDKLPQAYTIDGVVEGDTVEYFQPKLEFIPEGKPMVPTAYRPHLQDLMGQKGDKGEKGDKGDQGLRGLQGARGEQGIAGARGADGRTSYFHIKYSDVNMPSHPYQMTEMPSAYIGTYVDFEEQDSTDPRQYRWQRFQGLQGEKGEQGIPGVGRDGKTSYLHLKYSNDGGRSFTAQNGEVVGDYIGQCTNFEQNDPTSPNAYKWSKIKGENGQDGAKGEKGKDGLTPMPNLLHNAHLPQNLISWNKNTNNGGSINFEGNVTPPITGVHVWSAAAVARHESYGELSQNLSVVAGRTYTYSVYAKGANCGFFIVWPIGVHKPLVEAKQVGEEDLSDGWKRYAVTFTADKSGNTNAYLRAWYQSGQRQTGKVFFAAPKLEEGLVATPWVRASADFKGDNGRDGADGVGVSAVVTEYAVGSSESSAPSSGWSTTLPTWKQGQYLWTRSRVTFTDGRVTTTTPQHDPTWKKLSDLAYEQSHMAYLKQVFEQRAGIDGGLLFGAMLQMRDAPKKGASVGEVAAYFNGLRATKVGNAPRPALALGVNNFGNSEETESVAFNFDGSGHIGDLEFNGTGSLVTRGDDGQVLTEFTKGQRCNVSELVGKSQRNVSISSETIEVRGDGLETGRRTFTISSPYGRGEVSISVMCSGDYRDGEDERGNPYEYGVWARTIQTKVVLQKRQSNGVFTDFLVAYTYSSREQRDRGDGVCRLENLPAGTYRWSVELISKIFRNPDTSVYISYSTYTEGLIKPFNAIAGDGIMSFFSSEQYTFIKDGMLNIKGGLNIPGLLAAGRVNAEGGVVSKWGKVTRVWRKSQGEYLIDHTIGHTNYSIVITPLGNGNLMQGQLAAHTGDVAWCYIKDVQNGCRMVNTPFTFAIIGFD